MKVICTKLLAPAGEGTLESSPWVTVGAEYPVVSLSAYSNGRVLLQIVTDDGHSLGLFESTGFMTVDGTLPDSWEARIDEGGGLELAPPSWFVPGFWEDYYDGDPEAAEVVEKELSKILGEG